MKYLLSNTNTNTNNKLKLKLISPPPTWIIIALVFLSSFIQIHNNNNLPSSSSSVHVQCFSNVVPPPIRTSFLLSSQQQQRGGQFVRPSNKIKNNNGNKKNKNYLPPRILHLCQFATPSDNDNDNDHDHDHDESIEEEEDWRDFRAKLVMQFQKESSSQKKGKGKGRGGEETTMSSISSSSSSTQMYQENSTNKSDNQDLDTITPPSTSTSSSTSSSSKTFNKWAYDSGSNIEKGSIILSKPEQNFSYGLQQQYFHKAVILVLYHEDGGNNGGNGGTSGSGGGSTKGIILNRPSNLILGDDDFENEDGTPLEGGIDTNNKWRVWFGGDVNGLYSDEAEVICLHSLKQTKGNNSGSDDDKVSDVSEHVMKDIQWTTLSGAKALVNANQASPSDFWTFVGSCSWDAGQLKQELDNEAWHVIAVDSQTVVNELTKNGDCNTNPLDAGLGTWSMLMNMICGNDDNDDGEKNDFLDEQFDDLMLREWVKERLLFKNEDNDSGNDSGSGSGTTTTTNGSFINEDEQELDPFNDLLQKASSGGKSLPMEIGVGTLVIDSASKYNPFLLSDQEFHKSLVLIVQDDEHASVGIILNLPSASEVSAVDEEEEYTISSSSSYLTIPERYGGRLTTVDEEGKTAMVWLHNNQILRDAKIGAPLSPTKASYGIWTCSSDDVSAAISGGIATIQDFIVVSGCTIWEKTPGGQSGGIRGEIWNGIFDVLDPTEEVFEDIWSILLQQKVLSSTNIEENLELGKLAWEKGSSADGENKEDISVSSSGSSSDMERLVFESNVTIAELQSKSYRRWIGTYLLDMPNIRDV